MAVSGVAFLVGFAAEARIARLAGWRVVMGGGTTEGAVAAARRLIAEGVTGIVSFGLAGGLDPSLPAGTLIVAGSVLAGAHLWPTDGALNARLGGASAHVCLGLDHIAARSDEKLRLGRETGAALADMESGAVALEAGRAGVPFAVARAICDPAGRSLPPAALVSLDARGRIAPAGLAWSLMRSPGQIGALAGLAWDAALARRALRSHVLRLASRGVPMKGEAREG